MTGSRSGLTIRRAVASDAESVADLYLASFGATYTFPLAHTEAEVRDWVRDHVVPELETWVAHVGAAILGFAALSDAMLEHLYVHPDHTGRGVGSTLLRRAQARRPAGLELWTFQANERARRFYVSHGFREVELTDGRGNEEGQPDVRLAWRPGRL
jgi:GNAT superfamily N-acetyltransferase